MERSFNNISEVYGFYYDNDIDGVMYSTKHAMLYFNSMSYPRHVLFAKGHLSNGLRVYYFPKKSIFKDSFNHRIQILYEAGILNFWYMQRFPQVGRTSKKNSVLTLHIENVIGIVQVCGTMYVIAMIIFGLEVMSVIIPRIKNILDYLNY